MRYALRFWAENITPLQIAERALPLLAEYGAGVAVSVYRESLTDENARALLEVKDAGVGLSVWPLLSREEGYFPNEKNAAPYAALVEEVLDWALDSGVVPDAVAVDLELPYGQMMAMLEGGTAGRSRAALRMLRENRDARRFRDSWEGMSKLNSLIHSRGVRTVAAILPWVALELEGGHVLVQDLMETPVAGIDWDVLSPMWYVSMFTGMTGGLISERDANWLLYEAGLSLRCRYGPRAGVSLGLTGTGVLGDEPVFSSPEGLMVGVEASLAAGIRDISIYNLEGILTSEDPRSWMDALAGARPRVPERSRKVSGALAFGRVVYPPLAALVERVWN